MAIKASRIQPAAPKLNRARVNRHKVHYVCGLRAVLREMMHARIDAEAIAAATELEHALCGAVVVEGVI